VPSSTGCRTWRGRGVAGLDVDQDCSVDDFQPRSTVYVVFVSGAERRQLEAVCQTGHSRAIAEQTTSRHAPGHPRRAITRSRSGSLVGQVYGFGPLARRQSLCSAAAGPQDDLGAADSPTSAGRLRPWVSSPRRDLRSGRSPSALWPCRPTARRPAAHLGRENAGRVQRRGVQLPGRRALMLGYFFACASVASPQVGRSRRSVSHSISQRPSKQRDTGRDPEPAGCRLGCKTISNMRRMGPSGHIAPNASHTTSAGSGASLTASCRRDETAPMARL